MKLPNVSLPDQPQLQAVLNRMVAAINSASGSDIVAGRGIAITDSAGQQIIEASPEAVWQTRGLYPRILKNEGSAAVGLTPGFVTFLRDNTTSVSVVPYIGDDFATGTFIDDDAPPSEILDDETYYTRLKLEGGHNVKVDFVEASATPAKDAEYLIVNKFTLTTITGGDQVISDVEVYSQEPVVPSQNSQWFRVFDVTTSAPTFKVRVAAGRISAPDLSYVTSDPPTAVTLLDSYTVAETADLTVSDGSYVLLRIPLSTSKSYNKTLTGTGASITLNNYVLTYNAATGADVVVASSVTAPSSTYSYIVLAQISASDSGITIKQKHDGVVTVPAVTLPYPSALTVGGDTSDDSDLLFNTIATGGLDILLKEGQLAVSSYSPIAIDGVWDTMRVLKTIVVSSETLTLDNNKDQYIYLKVEFQLSASDAFRAQFQDVSLTTSIPDTYDTEPFVGNTGTAAPDSHTHAMDHSHTITLKSGGANELSAQLLVSFKEYYTHDIIVTETVQTDTDGICYFKIAKAVTAGGAVTSLKRYIKGCPITVPLVSVTYGSGIGD